MQTPDIGRWSGGAGVKLMALNSMFTRRMCTEQTQIPRHTHVLLQTSLPSAGVLESDRKSPGPVTDGRMQMSWWQASAARIPPPMSNCATQSRLKVAMTAQSQPIAPHPIITFHPLTPLWQSICICGMATQRSIRRQSKIFTFQCRKFQFNCYFKTMCTYSLCHYKLPMYAIY